MVLYYISGQADSIEYAKCERVMDLIVRLLPSVTVVKDPMIAERWSTEMLEVQRKWGFQFAGTSKVYVWSDSGMLIGGVEKVLQWGIKMYGVKQDLTRDELQMRAKETLEQSIKQSVSCN